MVHLLPLKIIGRFFLLLFITVLTHYSSFSQYTWNGSASQVNCHCSILTQAQPTLNGSVWNNNRIDLNQSFDFKFNVNLGCNDVNGADGIAFVLQNQSASIGGSGQGMGYGGISPGVGVTLDTYQNGTPSGTGDCDPSYDHIAIQLNGNVNHCNASTNIAGPVQISATSINVEDCNWHVLRITWDAPTQVYTTYFDGVLRLSVTYDFINNVFSGNPMVFWGFTGATGALSNLQQFCTTLTPGFNLQQNQARCEGQAVNFYDSSTSFGPIIKRYWNFGDGSPIDSININPTHTYLIGGDYMVTLTVLAIDGCSEVSTQSVHIGSIPIAKFGSSNACQDSLVNFTDSSSVQNSTINSWYWELGDGSTSGLQNPTDIYSSYGTKLVKLTVKSVEGCISDTVPATITIYPPAMGKFGFIDNTCAGGSIQFHDSSTVASGSINGWNWNLDDGQTSPAQNPTGTYLTPGIKSITLIAKTNQGCNSLPVTKPLNIIAKPIANFFFNTICQAVPVTLHDSSFSSDGSAINQWWWDLGNGSTATTNNVSTIFNTSGTFIIRHAVTTVNGCISDTVPKTITVNPKPLAAINYSSPLCAGIPVQFSDSTVTGNNTYNWIFDNGNTSTQTSPIQTFNAGNHSAELILTSNAGCMSDTATIMFQMNAKPGIGMLFLNSCKNTPVLFTSVDSTGNTVNQWRWDLGDRSSSSLAIAQHSYPVTGNYTIKLTGTSQAGCTSNTIQKVINIYGTNASAGRDVIAAQFQPVQLLATGGTSYQWTPISGLSDPNIANPIATIGSSQTYYLKAFTPQGCASYDTINIKIYKGPDIYLPNAFSPNNDGHNDVFHAIPIGISLFNYLKVYNRWGQQVYTSSDYSQGWDGRYKGDYQPAGVYLWMASGIDFKGNLIQKKGSVILIR